MVGYTFHALQQAYFSELSNKLIVIQYCGLVSQPLAIMQVLYEQLEEPWFEGHNIEDVRFDAQAFDANLSVPSLHKVRPKVMHYERKPILPPGLFNEFSNSEFWRQSNPTKAAFLRLSR